MTNQNSRFQIPDSRQQGFTLIEAVVATAVFVFTIASILGVYTAVLNLDQRTRAERAVTQNARFIMEYLAKEVRNGRIYYPGYPGGTVHNDTLALINQAGEAEYFYLSDGNLALEKTGGTTNLNSSDVTVTRLTFYISPDQDPYTPAKTFNQQPRVTVVLGLRSDFGSQADSVATINIQDTFSTRIYPSRE